MSAERGYGYLDEPEVEEEVPWHHRLDWSRMREPAVLYHLAGAIFGLLILVWPDRSTAVLGLLLGLGLVLGAAIVLVEAARARALTWARVVGLVVGAAVGVALILAPRSSDILLGQILGLALMVLGGFSLIRSMLSRGAPDRRWAVAQSCAQIALGLLLAIFPEELLGAVSTVIAVMLLVVGVAAVLLSLDPDNGPVAGSGHGGRQILGWLRSRYDTAGVTVPDLEEKVIFGPPLAWPKLAGFVTLMVLSSGISSLGVIADSTAVVIGAMLVAPLMTPLMGMAFCLVMGWPRRLAYVAAVALLGILVAITMGVVLGLISPTPVDVTNSQFQSRVNPTILDLMTAVFAGAAGAYAMSRRSVSDSLPGVAIAISLVPPLTIVGLSFSQGAWSSGTGALLLFLTNMLAILSVGGVTFVLAGAAPFTRMRESQHRLRTWIAALVALGALVVGGLMLNGAEIAQNTLRASEVRSVADTWAEAYPDHVVQDATLSDDELEVVLVGPDDDGIDVAELAARATEEFGEPITARVRHVVQEEYVSEDE